jgi:excisionase family DNA binding protein
MQARHQGHLKKANAEAWPGQPQSPPVFVSFELRYAGWRGGKAMTPTAQAGVVFPPRDLTALLDLGRFLEHHTEPALLLGPDGEQVPLPEEVYRVMVEVVEAMREGKVITLVPRTQRLTTQEAADFLGISRPTLVKLLEDGKIPYDQPGRHRRIGFTDLLAFAERQHEGRRAALDRMTEDASEAGIYGGTPEDYAAALKKARRQAARQ